MRVLAVVFAAAALLPAQEAKPASSYRVQIAVHESEAGKRLSTRNYSMLLGTERGRLNVGSRMATPSGGGQFQFTDVGATLSLQIHEQEGDPLLNGQIEFTLPKQEPNAPTNTNRFQLQVNAPVPAGKAVPLADFDDVGNRRFLVEATVTRVR
ncbi:MAG: hypothetical protein ACE15B_18705 [Bryobacteraceae bacterium]